MSKKFFEVGGFIFTVLCFIFCILMCSGIIMSDINACEYKYDNTVQVDRIFMGTSNQYTFIVNKDNGVVDVFSCYDSQPSIVKDVAANSKNYIKFLSNDRGRKLLQEIHLHAIEDIEPGGYNHGKFGKGSNMEIK